MKMKTDGKNKCPTIRLSDFHWLWLDMPLSFYCWKDHHLYANTYDLDYYHLNPKKVWSSTGDESLD
jgi:hypothetical protein